MNTTLAILLRYARISKKTFLSFCLSFFAKTIAKFYLSVDSKLEQVIISMWLNKTNHSPWFLAKTMEQKHVHNSFEKHLVDFFIFFCF